MKRDKLEQNKERKQNSNENLFFLNFKSSMWPKISYYFKGWKLLIDIDQQNFLDIDYIVVFIRLCHTD